MAGMGQLFLVRHGQASFGSANYDQLSELGTMQSRVLGEWFARCGQHFDRVVTGALQRHRQTADACMAALPSAEWQADPGFNEYDHHEITIRERPDFADPQAVRLFLAQADQPGRRYQE